LINYMKINWVISATFHRRGIKEWGIKFILEHNRWGTLQSIVSWGNHFSLVHEKDVIETPPTTFHVYQWLNNIDELKYSHRPVKERNMMTFLTCYIGSKTMIYLEIFLEYKPHYAEWRFSLLSDRTSLLSIYFTGVLKFKTVLYF
jgi:hypothetical protein